MRQFCRLYKQLFLQVLMSPAVTAARTLISQDSYSRKRLSPFDITVLREREYICLELEAVLEAKSRSLIVRENHEKANSKSPQENSPKIRN